MTFPRAKRLFAPASPNVGLIACGFASLAVWLAAMFVPDAAGPLGAVIHKPRSVTGDGPTWLLLFAFLPYAAAAYFARRGTRDGDLEIIGVFAAVLAFAAAIRLHPAASHDLFLYVFQGRAAAMHGLNPYAVLPSSVADPFVPLMGSWLAGFRDTYGPLWTSLAAALAAAVGDRPVAQIAALKAVDAAFFLGCAALVVAIGREIRGKAPAADARLAALFAWNPALLFELVQNGHNDVAMLFFLLGAVLLALRGRSAWAGAALAASFLVKYVTVVCLPFFVAYAVVRAGSGLRAKAAAAVRATLPAVLMTVAAYGTFWYGPGMLDGIMRQSSLASADVASPFALAVAVASSRGFEDLFTPWTVAKMTRISLFAFAAILAAFAAGAFRRREIGKRDFLRFAFAPLAVYLALASFWLMPWYLSWIMPLALFEGAVFAPLAFGIAGILLYGTYYAGVLLALVAVAAVGLPPTASRAFAAARRSWKR